MKKINVFLGSSIVELAADRNIFADTISELNTKLRHMEYFIYLDKCEYEDGFMSNIPTQETIDDKVLQSTYAYFLIKTKFGEMTEHEFNIAFDSFLNRGTPKLSVMFKKTENKEELSSEALQFKNRLENLKYYYNYYRSSDELKLNIVLNLVVDDILLKNKIIVEDGSIYIGDDQLANIDAIPMYSKHTELAKLNCNLELLEEDERKCSNKRERRIIREQINEIIKKINVIENIVFSTMLGLTKAARGEITPLLKRAIYYIENGQIEKAVEILNVDDVCDELESYKEKTEISLNGIQSAIETAYIAIESMSQLPVTVKRTKEIEKLYEQIVSLEVEYNLNPVYSGLYSKYLLLNGRKDKAQKYIYLYLENACRRQKSYKDYISSEYILLSLKMHIEDLLKDEPQKYQELLLKICLTYVEIYEGALDRFDQDINLNPYMFGIVCDWVQQVIDNGVGNKHDELISVSNKIKLKVEMLEQIGYRKVNEGELNGRKDAENLIKYINLEKELDKLKQEPKTDNLKDYLLEYSSNLERFLSYLKSSCNMQSPENPGIQKLHKDYENIGIALENNNDEQLLFCYIQLKSNYADNYYKKLNYKEAEKCFEEAYNKFIRLNKITENVVYDLFRSTVYLNYSNTLACLHKYEKAEKLMIESIEIREKAFKNNNITYEIPLAKAYINYAALCMRGRVYKCIDKSLLYLDKAYNIYEKKGTNLENYEKIDFIMGCSNLGLTLLENGKHAEALNYFIKGVQLISELDEKNMKSNHELIHNIIPLMVQTSIKCKETDLALETLKLLYTDEAAQEIVDMFVDKDIL